jgi:16S rRNA processing protein RimM
LNPENHSTKLDQDSAGPSTADEPAFIEAGFIRKPHGIKGEILVDLEEDLLPYFKPGQIVFIGAEHLKWSLVSIRSHKSGYLLLFNEINTPELVSYFRFKKLFLPFLDSMLEKNNEDEYSDDQILGFKVTSDNDEEIGYIKEIIKTGANDVYVIETGSIEILLPVIPDVILNIDVKKKKMTVHILPGLIPD